MKIKNAYLKTLFQTTEELEQTNRFRKEVHNQEMIRLGLVHDISFYNRHIELRIEPKEPRLTSFFLKIIWLDDPETLFRQWSVIDMDNINLTEYSKEAYKKIKDDTIDESFMNEFKSVVKLLC